MMHCVQCGSPVDPNSMSFEMQLVDIQEFCRRCFDEIMEQEDLPGDYALVQQLNKI
jgi:hypothetical protein